ncbi:MAG: DinB family protein [Nitriliruptorales bacterium]|nr:DinB family protein [Nitriliruptorales bacterium]
MTHVDEHGRPHPPIDANEIDTLLGFLDYQRATLTWKTDGLDADGLRTDLHPTTMTLGGLLKHLSFVEEYWFSYWLHGNTPQPPWDSVDWEADSNWDWNSAADDTPEELRGRWQNAVERSRELVAQALDNGGMDQLAERETPEGESPSLRWIVCHMIEEYARHNGHADLLRESIDGEVGE